MIEAISIDREAIADFCQRHHIRKLSLFGSVLRGDFKPESDVDVLVEFEPGGSTGFFAFIRMQDELSGVIGHAVDLRTPGDLSPYFQQEVLDEAQALYVSR